MHCDRVQTRLKTNTPSMRLLPAESLPFTHTGVRVKVSLFGTMYACLNSHRKKRSFSCFTRRSRYVCCASRRRSAQYAKASRAGRGYVSCSARSSSKAASTSIPEKRFETILLYSKNVRVTPGRFPEAFCQVRPPSAFGELSNGRLRLTGEVMPWVRSRAQGR